VSFTETLYRTPGPPTVLTGTLGKRSTGHRFPMGRVVQFWRECPKDPTKKLWWQSCPKEQSFGLFQIGRGIAAEPQLRPACLLTSPQLFPQLGQCLRIVRRQLGRTPCHPPRHHRGHEPHRPSHHHPRRGALPAAHSPLLVPHRSKRLLQFVVRPRQPVDLVTVKQPGPVALRYFQEMGDRRLQFSHPRPFPRHRGQQLTILSPPLEQIQLRFLIQQACRLLDPPIGRTDRLPELGRRQEPSAKELVQAR
jgi:hypothetical protein